MSDREALAAALDAVALLYEPYPITKPVDLVVVAARERLAQLRGGALVIEKDADGEWPKWATDVARQWFGEGNEALDTLAECAALAESETSETP